jgi:hypothetical protein
MARNSSVNPPEGEAVEVRAGSSGIKLAAGCIFTVSGAGVAVFSGVLSDRSKDVNPDCSSGAGGGGTAFATSNDGDSLSSLRSSWVNPPLPCPLALSGAAAGVFSTTDALSAVVLLMRSSVSGSPDSAPNTTLCTTGSARGFASGAGCAFAVSSAPIREDSVLKMPASSTGFEGFTAPKMPVAPKPWSELESSGPGDCEGPNPPGVVGLSISSCLRPMRVA